MNELEIRKIAKEEFINNVMHNIDSTLIFTYIQNLEQKVNNLQSKIDKANKYLEEHTDKLGKIKIPKIDFNYNKLSDILKEAEKCQK